MPNPDAADPGDEPVSNPASTSSEVDGDPFADLDMFDGLTPVTSDGGSAPAASVEDINFDDVFDTTSISDKPAPYVSEGSGPEAELEEIVFSYFDLTLRLVLMRAGRAEISADSETSIFDLSIQALEYAVDAAMGVTLDDEAEDEQPVSELWPDEQGFGDKVEVVEDKPERKRHRDRVRRPVGPPGPPKFDMVAIDLDGTLLTTDKKVSSFDVKTLKEASKRGVKVVIATARPPRSSRYIHELLGLDTLMVNYNGALIHNRIENRHEQHSPLPRDVARQIIDRAREMDPKVVVSIEVLDKWYTDHDDPSVKTETAKKFKPDFIGPLDVPLENDLTKLMFLGQAKPLKKISHALEKEFAGKAVFMRSDEHVLQIAHPQVDKARGVAWIAERLGIASSQCLALGDAPNDAGLLRWAGMGCAMANAFGEARDAADVIVESNDHDGVGQAIEDFVF